ncbi:hypothetical protein COCSUDRAFT_34205 [Coccomyxa subellipsoidea C-169]|uniref:Uncharacterized protein n=1 Tax=Coccomyxa subellipsoidea (strain C-169) TaxID=574566 RepID=I0YMQ3_COCSC|nr:hypothetical protein COCSUDRAFT_34205 [Coccomyxa subellipsoidea C-169]EIE19672.1 hypothetical protein COCSUDRAFT_34205 [Coccomyxa subellipsoidea C-169]|eukprot:XP_005644216.1 hypothetical protein COCSUDRAFT_34205 [Coccomyxa subellipsoidea C-169]
MTGGSLRQRIQKLKDFITEPTSDPEEDFWNKHYSKNRKRLESRNILVIGPNPTPQQMEEYRKREVYNSVPDQEQFGRYIDRSDEEETAPKKRFTVCGVPLAG